ncbi:hypothetical protein AB0C86_35820 [Streptomyces lavendulae]|uniref:hypothetical protein n=1 Tax=Streptomyces lavendulae TaxID=1914 RepID=UPI0033E3B298
MKPARGSQGNTGTGTLRVYTDTGCSTLAPGKNTYALNTESVYGASGSEPANVVKSIRVN